MIAYLEGQALVKKDHLIVLTGGVGYLVFVGSRLLSRQNGELIALYIYSHIKEDRFELYGFQTEEELGIFKMLIAISGVGPKTALSLADAGTDKLIEAVRQAQTSFFTNVPRVGKKLAQKIIIELKTKLGSLKELNLSTLSPKAQDVMDALLGLGFEENDIQNIMAEIDIESMDLQVAIKTIIKTSSNNNK
ncbi:MAG: Holliday junction ATP-dependent DNA helicase RuvA [Candidatus Pacebacteria bacterium GW2011_GWF2_38_9]|nr:MAG: Holliday junction ATP-dependent DNA helicase holliday junction DNA helicase RuvA [candidate division TM6 bacterium GW2011_GWF2_28_16]KKQ09304.1 MAG: Holliday junction ATP-dependent DNA helicase RuvA [Candidatus Pacebacteria bacterium GW2011_GWF1_36_5]KKQ88872.1 MAG: Holliday junction ATP-dependent DNA helicase RuvA [Candidatus Pacebacteria bacterium GW2011_GWF2_38_9]HAZ73431.1 Holliday junction branch migration protein RuvA [Candidatus Paceibacterota bacterium]